MKVPFRELQHCSTALLCVFFELCRAPAVDEEKMQQEKRSLQQISDSFKKIVVVGERMKLRRDEQGIVLMGVYEFLADQNLLDV